MGTLAPPRRQVHDEGRVHASRMRCSRFSSNAGVCPQGFAFFASSVRSAIRCAARLDDPWPLGPPNGKKKKKTKQNRMGRPLPGSTVAAPVSRMVFFVNGQRFNRQIFRCHRNRLDAQGFFGHFFLKFFWCFARNFFCPPSQTHPSPVSGKIPFNAAAFFFFRADWSGSHVQKLFHNWNGSGVILRQRLQVDF